MVNDEHALKTVINSLAGHDPWKVFREYFYNYIRVNSNARFLVVLEGNNREPFFYKNENFALSDILKEWKTIRPVLDDDVALANIGDISIFKPGLLSGIELLILLKNGKTEDSGLWSYLLRLHFNKTLADSHDEIPKPGLKTGTFTEKSIPKESGFIYHSHIMKQLVQSLDKISQTEVPVLLTGESGTGKELLARMIHDKSRRKNTLFLPINCAALTETLLETELFGYMAGSFTDATMDHPGKLAAADKGTLFLDEVGEMSLGFQSKLMRFLETGEYVPVGGIKTMQSDVRIIAATNRNLSKDISNGRFRSDFYYRISVCRLDIPPLRNRKDDIAPLVAHFLVKHSVNGTEKIMMPDALYLLMDHDWPGNVRELENVVHRLMTLTDCTEIGVTQLYDISGITPNMKSQMKSYKDAVNLFKKRLIRSTLEIYNNNQTQAARVLGLQRTYLVKLIDELNIRFDSEN